MPKRANICQEAQLTLSYIAYTLHWSRDHCADAHLTRVGTVPNSKSSLTLRLTPAFQNLSSV